MDDAADLWFAFSGSGALVGFIPALSADFRQVSTLATGVGSAGGTCLGGVIARTQRL